MNKFIPKAKQPGSHVFPNGGATNNQTMNSARRGAGQIAPKPGAKAPEAIGLRNFGQSSAPEVRNPGGVAAAGGPGATSAGITPQGGIGRVKGTGKGPQLGISTNPTGPQPGGLQKGTPPKLGATASNKPRKSTHPFFGSNNLGY